MSVHALQTVKDAGNLAGKRVIVRVDLNVPVENGKVADDFRIKRALPTIEHLKNEGARLILLSHMSGNEVNSLKPVADYLSSKIEVRFIEEYFTEETKALLDNMKDGDIFLFENLRIHSGEKENDEMFVKSLASMGELYVNEAFAVSHREHASIVGLPKVLPSYAGNLFVEEVKNLSIALNPPRPFLFILGGAKFGTKIPLAKQFVSIADHVVLGGALSSEIFEEKGMEVGRSLVSEENFHVEGDIEKMILPKDLRVERDRGVVVIKPEEMRAEDRIVDIGPATIELIKELSKKAKCILWNGPVGEYKEGYKETSLEIARAISESGAITITGGGDTLSAISEIKVEDKFTFVSTAGGAMLDFLADGTLPGIIALEEAQSRT